MISLTRRLSLTPAALLLLLASSQLSSAWYDPGVQRWINRDPVGEAGGINLFGFARGNAVNWFDRDGLKAATIECRGGKYNIILNWAKGEPYESCVIAHEQQHIDDWKRRYGEDSCKGVADGSLPKGGPDYEKFLHDSECKAHAIGRDCAKRLCHSERDPANNGEDQIYAYNENRWLGANKCAEYQTGFKIFN
jgi:hypothetical protein